MKNLLYLITNETETKYIYCHMSCVKIIAPSLLQISCTQYELFLSPKIGKFIHVIASRQAVLNTSTLSYFKCKVLTISAVYFDFDCRCEFCQKGFDIRNQFESHRNRHLGHGLQCKSCGNIYYHEKHFRIHLNKRICGVRYKSLEAAAIPIRLTEADFVTNSAAVAKHTGAEGVNAATSSTLIQQEDDNVKYEQSASSSSSEEESDSEIDEFKSVQVAMK